MFYFFCRSLLLMILTVSIGNLFISSSSIANTSLMKLSTPSLFEFKKIKNKSESLNEDEWSEAVKIGSKAIKMRIMQDSSAKSFTSGEISPDIRHRRAVSTSPLAGRLALAGIGEIAASHYIEKLRKSRGINSAIGAYFDGEWAPEGLYSCKIANTSELCEKKSKFRSVNGWCNRPGNHGAAFRKFKRLLPPAYADGIDSPRQAKSGKPLPSARKISLQVHGPSPSSNPSFTVMTAVFGQFLDHDITATAISQINNDSSLACCPPNPQHPECFPVDVGPGDPFYDITGSRCMEFVRSAPAQQCKIGAREQLNQVSNIILYYIILLLLLKKTKEK